MRWSSDLGLTLLFPACVLCVVVGGWLIGWLLRFLTGKNRKTPATIPWRFSLGSMLLATTAAAVVLGVFRDSPGIAIVLSLIVVFCGLSAGRYVQMRRELVRRREQEMRAVVDAARSRQRPESSPGTARQSP